jgi:hypothetical protein
VRVAEAARLLETRIYEHLRGRDPSWVIWAQITALVTESGIEDLTELPKLHADLLVSARLLSLLCNRHFESRMHRRLNALSIHA